MRDGSLVGIDPLTALECNMKGRLCWVGRVLASLAPHHPYLYRVLARLVLHHAVPSLATSRAAFHRHPALWRERISSSYSSSHHHTFLSLTAHLSWEQRMRLHCSTFLCHTHKYTGILYFGIGIQTCRHVRKFHHNISTVSCVFVNFWTEILANAVARSWSVMQETNV